MATSSEAGQTPSQDGASFVDAHRQMLADPTLQFELEAFAPPPPPPPWPQWLIDFLNFLAPLMQWVFWGGVALLGLIVVVMIVREIARRLPERAGEAEKTSEAPRPEFRPQKERARALLEEADRLAREGRFSEAVRVLLHRSIEDIERAFPLSVHIAMTSREISRIEPLSAHGRNVFSGIAHAVETSLFGGAPLDAARYAQCRSAYEAFAFEGGRK